SREALGRAPASLFAVRAVELVVNNLAVNDRTVRWPRMALSRARAKHGLITAAITAAQPSSAECARSGEPAPDSSPSCSRGPERIGRRARSHREQRQHRTTWT